MGIVHSHEDEDKLAFFKKMYIRHFHISQSCTLFAPENFA